ncbi:MAG: hypothetical protein KDK70_07075 [Myxococcales bacterium]|nr:hypothetical protein [Myxococcales bacterium]
MTPLRPLSAVFWLDALLGIGFGLVSWLFPMDTYATIVDLGGIAEGRALTLSTLASLSAFYVFIGLVCLCAGFMPRRQQGPLALVMLVRHGWIGSKGLHEAGREWLVGDPWPDIVIHAVFVIAYAAAVVVLARSRHRV